MQAETHLYEDGGQGPEEQRQISCTVDFCSHYLICSMQICMLHCQEFWDFGQEDMTIKQFERQRLEGRSDQVMGKVWRQTEIRQRRVGEGRTTNRKWSFKNKPYPEKCQIVFHSSRNNCLGSQGRTQFGGIVKKTTSSQGKMRRAWCPDTGWSAVLFLLKSDLKYMKYRFLWLKTWNDKWLLWTRRKHMHCPGPLKSAKPRA